MYIKYGTVHNFIVCLYTIVMVSLIWGFTEFSFLSIKLQINILQTLGTTGHVMQYFGIFFVIGSYLEMCLKG